MFTLNDYKGVIPAFITPFDRDGNYSESCATEMIEWLISKGIGGTYNLYPDLYIRAINRFFKGDIPNAQNDMLAANAILEILIKYDTQSAMRTGLSFMGIDAGFNPEPFGVLEGERKEAFKNELKELKSKLDIESIALFDAI